MYFKNLAQYLAWNKCMMNIGYYYGFLLIPQYWLNLKMKRDWLLVFMAVRNWEDEICGERTEWEEIATKKREKAGWVPETVTGLRRTSFSKKEPWCLVTKRPTQFSNLSVFPNRLKAQGEKWPSFMYLCISDIIWCLPIFNDHYVYLEFIWYLRIQLFII